MLGFAKKFIVHSRHTIALCQNIYIGNHSKIVSILNAANTLSGQFKTGEVISQHCLYQDTAM
jgi:hypothetical protein